MSLPVFELACLVVIALTLLAMARVRPWRSLLADYAALAVAGWIGEESCIRGYRFYAYAPGWHARLADVPLLVPLIWPLVILSARDVAAAIWPGVRTPVARALLVGAVVAFDASLVESIAVRAGLWRWVEPGHLDVPVIGILGWGYFAVGASLALSLRSRLRYALVLVLGPLVAHALILASWWGLFRWTVRGDLGAASVLAMAILGALALVLVVRARARGDGMPPAVGLPRIVAAALFFALLVATAPGALALWIHTLAVGVPYVAAQRAANG